MMKRSSLRVALSVWFIVGMVGLFVSTGIFAEDKMPDVIKMENKAYEKHKNPIVMFAHKKHSEDYAKKDPELYKRGCGECHHDENHKPLSDLKACETVKGCIQCHTKPGEMPIKEKKAMREQKLSKEEQDKKTREYHAEAIHDNCKGCHRDHNKKNKLKSKDEGYAPTTCKQCHIN